MSLNHSRIFRFLIVGAINTAFGYLVFAALNYWFKQHSEYGYLFASVLANLITITTNYLAYKFFVFKTKGNCLREYFRFLSIYGASIGIGLILLPLLVQVCELNSYLAGALLIPISALFSFLGHSGYSFREQRKEFFGNDSRDIDDRNIFPLKR